jgi:hypothetical protein
MRAPTTSPQQFVIAMVLITLTAALGIASLNWWVDPFQQYREATHYTPRYTPRYYNAQQRFVNPGLAKHADYNRIVMGSSLMENVDNTDVDRAFAVNDAAGRSINLSMSAMTAYDANQLLTLATRVGKVKHVIINLDYNAFSGAPSRSGFDSEFPTYLYDQTIFNDAPYLMSLDTTRKSIDILRSQKGDARYSESRTRPWFWADSTVFSAAKTVRDLDPRNLNKQFKQPNRSLIEMRASFDQNILRLARDNPDVTFSFVYLPYSILVWADFQQRNQIDVTLNFRDYAFAATQSYRNVQWFDFQAASSLVNDLSHYTDIYHFSPLVSRQIIQSIAKNEYRLTAATLAKNNQWLREAARTVDAAAVIAAAKK